MPNWCYNELRITGDIQQLNKIRETISSLKDRDDVLYCLTGVRYKDQAVFKEDLLTYTEDDLICIFNTRWEPIRKFVDDLCKLYKVGCSYHYSEPNEDFAGIITYKDGEFLDEEEYTESEYRYIYYKNDFLYELLEMILSDGNDIDEYKEQYTFLSEEDWNEIELKYNTNKFNL